MVCFSGGITQPTKPLLRLYVFCAVLSTQFCSAHIYRLSTKGQTLLCGARVVNAKAQDFRVSLEGCGKGTPKLHFKMQHGKCRNRVSTEAMGTPKVLWTRRGGEFGWGRLPGRGVISPVASRAPPTVLSSLIVLS